jgi:hypothetical protein
MSEDDDADGGEVEEEGGPRKRLRNGEGGDGASSSSSPVDPLDGLKLKYFEALDALEVARVRLLAELERRRQGGVEVEFDYKELRDMLPSMNALVTAPSSSSEEETVAPVVAVGYSSFSTVFQLKGRRQSSTLS